MWRRIAPGTTGRQIVTQLSGVIGVVSLIRSLAIVAALAACGTGIPLCAGVVLKRRTDADWERLIERTQTVRTDLEATPLERRVRLVRVVVSPEVHC